MSGQMSFSTGIPLVETEELKAGVGIMTGGRIYLGTRPWTEIEKAGWHAKWIVNNGLRDVVLWLGEKPIRKHHPTYNRSLLEMLRDAGGASVDAMDFLS